MPRPRSPYPSACSSLARSTSIAAYVCGALTAATLAVMAGGPASAGEAAVYRCRGAEHQITYTDTPCPGGDRVQMKPGNPDPEAVRKLAFVRAELDRSAAQRHAARAAEEARNREIERMRQMMEERDHSAPRDQALTPAPYYDYPGGGWYLPYDGRRVTRLDRSTRPHARSGPGHSHDAGKSSRAAPNPPFPVPRR